MQNQFKFVLDIREKSGHFEATDNEEGGMISWTCCLALQRAFGTVYVVFLSFVSSRVRIVRRAALMGQDQSKSSMTAFSNSFDSATVYQTNRHSLAPRRADSTASDDTQSTSLKEPNRPIAGSTGSLQANSTGLRRQKKMSMERRSGSSTRSTSTNGMAKSQRTQSQSAKSVSKKNGISGSSQAIINFCIENAKGDVASRVVTRMANKREDFNQFLGSLNSENWNAFVGSLRDYFHAVVQNLQSSDKIKEISVQYGADQVPRRAWGFKADYFAVMASALTTECVFLDGAAHQPTEAIEAWAELAELMFSNIRDGYYQRIRYLRKNSHCFNQLFTQSSDQSTEDNSNQLLTPNPSPNRLSPNPNSKPPTDRRNSTLRTQNTLVSGDTVRS
uniref:GLOBIN domain-containing protein n=1 Tax=Bursaphelenchus xylophilus TaxID=6326 RepID=A0A1I7SQX1_BURXY